MSVIIVILTCIFSLLIRSDCSGQEVPSLSVMEEKYIGFLSGNDLHGAEDQLELLFANAELSVLKRSQNDSIAIQAAWQEVFLTFAEVQANTPHSLSSEKLEWFLGFLEGRAHLDVPQWWRNSVLGLVWERGRLDIPEPTDPDRDLYHVAFPNGLKIRCHPPMGALEGRWAPVLSTRFQDRTTSKRLVARE